MKFQRLHAPSSLQVQPHSNVSLLKIPKLGPGGSFPFSQCFSFFWWMPLLHCNKASPDSNKTNLPFYGFVISFFFFMNVLLFLSWMAGCATFCFQYPYANFSPQTSISPIPTICMWLTKVFTFFFWSIPFNTFFLYTSMSFIVPINLSWPYFDADFSRERNRSYPEMN